MTVACQKFVQSISELPATGEIHMEDRKRGWPGALSIQQKSPVLIFGILAGRKERVRPLRFPRIRGHVLCNTGHAAG